MASESGGIEKHSMRVVVSHEFIHFLVDVCRYPYSKFMGVVDLHDAIPRCYFRSLRYVLVHSFHV